MYEYTIEIGDSKGKSFKILLTLPFTKSKEGSWRAIDKGFIRYNSGVAKPVSVLGTGEDDDLHLLSSAGTPGLQLNDLQDFWGMNDQGTGALLQAWVIGIEPGKISWVYLP